MGKVKSINGNVTNGAIGITGHQGQAGVSGIFVSDEYKREIIIKKWIPVVENNIPTRNKKIIENCALYCEWYLSIDENYTKASAGEDLNNRLEEIKKRIGNIDRIDIVCKSYNPISGEIEYKLSNGKYIPLTGGVEDKLSDEQLTVLFDIEFIKEINIQLYRDLKIDKIII
jgi:hypothetical protein